jgi:putative ABC transport system permease protein
VSMFALHILVSLIPESIPRVRPIEVDHRTFLFATAASVVTALAFGVVPAWHASRACIGGILKQSSAGAAISVAWRGYRNTLIIAEVALSLVLLTGAGLMIQSVTRLLRVDPGFDSNNLLFVHLGLLRGEKYYAGEDQAKLRHLALFAALHERLAALRGVRSVGIMKRDFFSLGYSIEGREGTIGLLPAGSGVDATDAFKAMRTPLLAGRYFEPDDIGPNIGAVIINETMARLCWPEGNPLNKRFKDRSGRNFEVVGVVADTRTWRYDDRVEPTYYRTFHEGVDSGGFGPYFIVRTENDPKTLIPMIREAIKQVETSMTTPWFEVIRDELYERTQPQRVYMLYMVIFAAMAIVLAALGIYGVIAYSVSRRTREIGVRIAVGAQGWQIAKMILWGAARVISVGVVIGGFLALNLTRVMKSQLFHVNSIEPSVMIAAILILSCVGLAACWIPARRAAKLNPVQALRYE